MSNTWGSHLHLSIFGESHGNGIGMVLDGIEPGTRLDLEKLAAQMKRRAPGGALATARKEADEIEWVSGIRDGKNIDMDTFWEIPMAIPCLEEQQKIADFLSLVDEVITASEEEVANLETQKKAVMKKVFSQEVRFKKPDGSDFPEWEEKRLDEVVEFLDGMRKPIETGDRVAGPYPYYGASGITDYVEGYIFDEDLILLSEDGANILDRNYRVCFMARGKYWVNNHAHVLRANTDCVNEYICEYLESLDYSRMNSGSAQPKLNQQTCRKIPVKKPCLEEQRLIANFLSDFDEAIAAAKKELELWKELKKGLLQQMFV